MDSKNLFSFFIEDKKTHFSVTIPGHPTNQFFKIRCCSHLPKKAPNLTLSERTAIINHYQEQGLLAAYTEQEIKNMCRDNHGWIIASPWKTLTDYPISERIFEDSAYHTFKKGLLQPLCQAISQLPARSYTEYTVPVLPRIVTASFVDQWYQSNQSEAAYLGRLQQKSEQTRIVAQHQEGKIILKIKDTPFVNQPIERILLYPNYPQHFSKKLSLADQDFLRLKLLRRDAFRLKGASDHERTCFTHLHPTGTGNRYQIHWIKWLSLNGDMSAQNAILVSRDTGLKYNILVQKPFTEYWEKNWKKLAQTGKEICVDIPIPMVDYRPTPIRPTHTKRQDRRHLNRMTKLMADNYQHEY